MGLIPAAACFFACSGFGWWKNHLLAVRLDMLQAFQRDMPRLLGRMEYQGLPLGALAEAMAEGCALPPAFWLSFRDGLTAENVETAWGIALAEGPFGLQQEDKALLAGLGAALAAPDGAARKQTASGLLRELEQHISAVRLEKKEKGELYGTLGLLLGLAGAILVL